MRDFSSFLIGLPIILAVTGVSPGATGKYSVESRRLSADYSARLGELATWAEREHLADEAAFTRTWSLAAEPNLLRLAISPSVSDPPYEPPAAFSKEWRERFLKLRTEHADELFKLAKDAATAGQSSLAFQILPAVLREDPDHEQARKILGYEQYDGRWLTPFEIGKAREGQVWHARFGWLPADHVARYEKGERYYGGRWLSAEAEQRLRATPRKGWAIVTEHYNVQTTHSLEEGVRLATRLERLYDAWQQLFSGFYATDAQLARRFAGQAAKRSTPQRHKVVYFRNREEYIQALEKDEPQIGISTGFYLAAKRTAFFYADGADDDSNLYHEATHQLFSEIRPSVRDVGRTGNFWIVEGIACYMESLTERDGWHLLGGSDATRLRDAEHRLLADDFYVPLAELNSYGMERLKRDPRIAMLYSQSSGLTYFLINADDGRYRGPLVALLAAIYQGRDRAATLSELCGASDGELDAQYREYIRGLK